MKKLFKILGIFTWVITITFQASAYVTVSGNVSGQYWHNTDTYYVSGNLTVDADSTFEIQSGTRVKFAHNTSLTVYGTFIADGNSGAYITFTSMDDDDVGALIAGSDGNPEAGDWTYIYLNGDGSTNQGIGNMDYCRVLYAGGAGVGAVYFYKSDTGYFTNSLVQYSGLTGFRAEDDTLTVTNSSFLDCDSRGVYSDAAVLNLNNSTFNNNGSDGIYAYSTSELQINNCQFNNNDGYAARLLDINITTYSGNTGSGNGIDAFGISGNIDQDITLSESGCGFPYVLLRNLELSAGYTMTIPAGEVIKCLSTSTYVATSLVIYGTLNAIGTASDSIIFTSFYDDTHGGDLNGDGSATTPAKGNWGGLYLNGDGTSYQGIGNMDYCKVLYTGHRSNPAVRFNKSDTGYFTNSLVQYSDNHGVYAQTAVLNLNNSTFNNNGGDGIYAVGTSELQINNCQFYNNDDYAVRLTGINITTYSGNTGSGNGIDAFGISGNIDQDITLSESGCGFPYVLIGDVVLPADYTMTIPAGDVIKCLGSSSGLTINGTLNAIGTASDSIVFTSLYDDTHGGDLNGDGSATTPAKGDWKYIYLYGSGTTNQGIGNMDYCKVLYGGGSPGGAVYFNTPDEGYFTNSLVQYSDNHGVYAQTAVLNLNNSTFNNNGGNGIYAVGTSELQINNCQFYNNDDYAARLTGINITTYSGNTGSGNGIDAFGISGNIDQDITLSESGCGFPYVLIGDVVLPADYTMTIPAGDVIKCLGSSSGLTINGTLNAIGTASDSIVFTSLYDDTHGGDLNGDGSATTPAKGDWKYIYLYGSGTTNQGIGNMDYCKVLYAGGSPGGAVYFNTPDEGYFTNSLVQYSDYVGLSIYYSAITVRNNTFQDNDSYGVYIYGPPVPNLGQNIFDKVGLNTFINNDGGNYQLYNFSAQDINAYYNDWGYYTASEIDAHIYDDNEDAGKGEVLVNPWYDPSNPTFDVTFGGDTLSGKAPFPVHFYDSTFFGATSWQWDFDNDDIIDDTTQNPWWVFYEEGLYSVKLVASNGPQKDSITFSDYIDVNGIQDSHALEFDGTDDYVLNEGFSFPDGDLTIEAWIYPISLGDLNEIVYLYCGAGGCQVQFRVRNDGLLLYGEYANLSWNAVASTPGKIVLNTWTHIAITKQGDNCSLYINGINEGNNQFDNDPAPDILCFGARPDFQDRYFNGMIDEVRIWNIARSITSIQEDMYRAIQGDETGLVSYWQFNEGFSPVTGDSVSGSIGTLHNMDNDDWKISTAPIPFYTLSDGDWGTNSTWATGQNVPTHPWSRAMIKHNVTLNSNMELIEISIDTNAVLNISSGSTLTVEGE